MGDPDSLVALQSMLPLLWNESNETWWMILPFHLQFWDGIKPGSGSQTSISDETRDHHVSWTMKSMNCRYTSTGGLARCKPFTCGELIRPRAKDCSKTSCISTYRFPSVSFLHILSYTSSSSQEVGTDGPLGPIGTDREIGRPRRDRCDRWVWSEKKTSEKSPSSVPPGKRATHLFVLNVSYDPFSHAPPPAPGCT